MIVNVFIDVYLSIAMWVFLWSFMFYLPHPKVDFIGLTYPQCVKIIAIYLNYNTLINNNVACTINLN